MHILYIQITVTGLPAYLEKVIDTDEQLDILDTGGRVI